MNLIITPEARYNGGGFTKYGKYRSCRTKPCSRQLYRQPKDYPQPITKECMKKPSQRFKEAMERALKARDEAIISFKESSSS